MTFDRILLTTDLSNESLRAFAPLAALAKAQGSTVLLLHVVEEVALTPRGAPFAASIHLPGADEDKKEAEEWLAAYGSSLLDGLPVELHVIKASNVDAAIADFAAEHNVSLIAMASHGRSGFRALLLGSVAAGVLRHSALPVMVFPRQQ